MPNRAPRTQAPPYTECTGPPLRLCIALRCAHPARTGPQGRAKPHNQHALGRGQGNGRKPFAARQRRRHAHGAKGHGPHGRGDNLARVVLCAGANTRHRHSTAAATRYGRPHQWAGPAHSPAPPPRPRAGSAGPGRPPTAHRPSGCMPPKHAAASPKNRPPAPPRRPPATTGAGAQRPCSSALPRPPSRSFTLMNRPPAFPVSVYPVRAAHRISALFYDRARRPAYFVCLRRRQVLRPRAQAGGAARDVACEGRLCYHGYVMRNHPPRRARGTGPRAMRPQAEEGRTEEMK